jgi:hypothetical protein
MEPGGNKIRRRVLIFHRLLPIVPVSINFCGSGFHTYVKTCQPKGFNGSNASVDNQSPGLLAEIFEHLLSHGLIKLDVGSHCRGNPEKKQKDEYSFHPRPPDFQHASPL